MATAEEYFTHLLQSYGSFKGGDPQSRRQVATKVLEFLENESAYVNFENVEATNEVIGTVDDSMTYAPEEAEVALD